LLARRLGKRGGLQNLTCFLLLPIAASNINSGYTGMMVRWEWFVGEGGIIDLDLIIPIQPETI
jgi:hypothetical protein